MMQRLLQHLASQLRQHDDVFRRRARKQIPATRSGPQKRGFSSNIFSVRCAPERQSHTGRFTEVDMHSPIVPLHRVA